MRQHCDKCGIAVEALYEIKTLAGSLFFCGHHRNAFDSTIIEQAYEVLELKILEEVQALV